MLFRSRRDIPFIELDVEINDAAYAEACVKALLENIRKAREKAAVAVPMA